MIINNMNFPLWTFLFPFAVILFWDVKKCHKNEWHNDSLSLNHSKDILGFFALMIVVHHSIQFLIQNKNADVGIMGIYENFGVCFVGGFFFFSGYGLIKSYYSKKDYLNDFFQKRILKIIIPFYIVNTFFVIVTKQMGMLDKEEIPLCSLGIIMPNDHMWYLVEIVVLYYMFYKNFKNPESESKAFKKMFIQIVILIFVSLILGHGPFWFQGEWWYNTTLLFFIGMVIAKHEKTTIAFAKKHYAALTAVTAVAFLALHLLTVYIINTKGYWTEYGNVSRLQSILDKLQALSVQLPMVICFVMLVLLIGLKIKTGNQALSFLGTISLELYITHRLWIWVFEWIKREWSFLFLVLSCSIVLACVFHYIISFAFRLEPVVCRIISFIKKAVIKAGDVISDLSRAVKIKKYSTWGIIFIMPFFTFYVIFSLVPLVSTVANSFFENYSAGLKHVGPNFVGLANYQKLLESGDFWKYLGNTMLIWILGFIPQISLSLLLAYWFSDKSIKIKGERFFKTVIYMPNLIMATAMASLFLALFSYVGPINDFFVDTIKIWPERYSFLTGIWSTRGLIIFMNFLMWFGNTTLLLMAGMMNVDVSLYEAARVDGATPGTVFRKITMPLIKPVFIYVVITSLISGMQLFDIPQILTDGSGDPVRTSFTLVMFLNNYLFSKNYGMAGAISTLMFLVTASLSLAIFFFSRKEDK